MKPDDILDMIGDAKGAYVWDAQIVRSGAVPIPKRKLPTKKMWLIAAAIALAAVLVGCAVVYALRLQDMKVGKLSFTLPTYYDEDGNVIYAYDENGNPITQETMPPISLISLQGANMEAMTEWVAFKESYDPDGAIAIAARENGSDLALPENYHFTYGCHSQEMVDKLEKIVKKYDLNLLSTSEDFQYYESGVLFDAMRFDSVFQTDAPVELEYGTSCLYPEGTFDISFVLTVNGGNWQCKDSSASYRYSIKDYFDPATGSYEPGECTEWNYTRKDGITVLLVQSRQWAQIYADLGDAFVSFSFQPVVTVDNTEIAMTKEQVEQVAEFLDFTIDPHPADMEKVKTMKAEADAQHKAELAAEKESLYNSGYAEYIQKRLDVYGKDSRAYDSLKYALYDINGDGVEELITHAEILSMKDGESYVYFSTYNRSGIFSASPCKDGVIELSDCYTENVYYFRADANGTTYLEGLEKEGEQWYLIPEDPFADSAARIKEPITDVQAQQIKESHPELDLPWQLMKRFGQPVETKTYYDPYAAYIANQLDCYDDANIYTYALMDLDGDGVEELICRNVRHGYDGETEYLLSIHTIVNGKLSDMGLPTGFNYVCEDGILEVSEVEDTGGAYYQYYKIENGTAVRTDKVVQDPSTRYWGVGLDGGQCKTVWEEEARAVIASHKRIDLDMKPFTEYPLK